MECPVGPFFSNKPASDRVCERLTVFRVDTSAQVRSASGSHVLLAGLDQQTLDATAAAGRGNNAVAQGPLTIVTGDAAITEKMIILKAGKNIGPIQEVKGGAPAIFIDRLQLGK